MRKGFCGFRMADMRLFALRLALAVRTIHLLGFGQSLLHPPSCRNEPSKLFPSGR
jgi:hypothetical protein